MKNIFNISLSDEGLYAILVLIFLYVTLLIAILNKRYGYAFLVFQIGSQRYNFSYLILNSLSIRDIAFLARLSDDGTEILKQFYEWKHKTLSFSIKAILTFLLGNLALIVKVIFDEYNPIVKIDIITKDLNLQIILIVLSGFIIFIEFFMIMKIRDIPQEYIDAVTIYNALKQ